MEIINFLQPYWQWVLMAAGLLVLLGAIFDWHWISNPTIEDKNHPFTHFILELWGVKGFRVSQGILGIILMGYGLLYLFIG